MSLKNSRQSATKPRRFAGFVAALALTAGMVTMPLPASAATHDEVESSILLVGTTWTGYIYVPAYDDADGLGFWTDEIVAFSTCTGWFASDEGHIITAGHCVDPAEGRQILIDTYFAESGYTSEALYESAILNWSVEGPREGDPLDRSVQVIQPDRVEGAVITDDALTAQIVEFRPFDEGDVALLQVSGIEDTPPLVIAESNPEVGEALTAIGFPADVQSFTDASRIRASFKAGTASSQQFSVDGVAGTEINAETTGGMSGGPTINEKGQVLGVISWGIGEASNTNFITDTNDLKRFLNNNDVEFVPAPVDDGMGWVVPVIIIGIILLLLIAAALFYFLVIRKKKPAQAEAAQPVAVQEPVGAAQVTYPASAGVVVPPMPPPPQQSDTPIFRPSPPAAEQAAPMADAPAVEEPTVEAASATPPGTVYCRECGTGYAHGTKFCANDGMPLTLG